MRSAKYNAKGKGKKFKYLLGLPIQWDRLDRTNRLREFLLFFRDEFRLVYASNDAIVMDVWLTYLNMAK